MTGREQGFITALESMLSQLDTETFPEPHGDFALALGDRVVEHPICLTAADVLAITIAAAGQGGVRLGMGAILSFGIDLGRQAQMAVEEKEQLERSVGT